MAQYDDVPYIIIERRSGGAAPFVWGALIGAGVALLLAPRSGEETQEELRQSARRLRMAAEDRVNSVRDDVTGTITRTRNQLHDRLDTVRSVVESRTEQARHAVDAGRRAALDARAELQRRVAEAKENVQSVTDAVRASAPSDHSGGSTPSMNDVDVVVTEVVTEMVIEDVERRPDLG